MANSNCRFAKAVRANPKSSDKVAILTLGGAGHEPALSGFVGEGAVFVSQSIFGRTASLICRYLNVKQNAKLSD